MRFRYALLLVLGLLGSRIAAQEPFTIRVVDSQTGRGVPLVELLPQGAPTLITDSNGIVALSDPALLDGNAFFGFRSYGYSDWGQTLRPTAGGSVEIAIDRRNLAERLYRVTGTGIYRDSVLAGHNVPIDEPLLNANVSGQDSVQTAIYQGQIYWFWGDTLYESGDFPNFRTSGARSQLPGQGGLDPALGVNLDYFVNPANGNAKQMMPIAQTGLVWIDGLFTAPDEAGNERMLARYSRHLSLTEKVEQGLALFNDATETFQRFQTYDLAAPIVPQGHAFRHTAEGEEYIYFALTYPDVRVKANWGDVTNIAAWEAYTPLRAGSRYDAVNPPLDLDVEGNPIFGWKTGADPLSYEMLEDLVQRGHIARDELPFRLEDSATGDPVRLHRSSVHWNEYRQSWVMIGVESFGDSFLGEVWFAEAPAPEGPWENAVKVATHDRGSSDYSFYNPTSHPFFDQEGGRFIYFEGTYSNTFSGNATPTPLYDYNQMMYRLDLATIADLFPRLAGDYNGDGVVDAGDYTVWRDTLGSTTVLAADGSRNAVVDAEDYAVWRENFGAVLAESAAASVPEPSGWALSLVIVAACGGRRRRWRVCVDP